MKHALLAASVIPLLLLGCAGVTSEKPAPAAADKRGELLVDATTRPAAAPAAGTAEVPEPQPSRPYYPRADLAAGYVVDPTWPLLKPTVPWGPMAGAAV